MDVDLHPERSVLHAQVRKAKSNHCVDEAGRYLRSAHHKGPSSKVYLGDVCETLLKCCVGAETPVFTEVPGFDEQRWMLEFTVGALHVSVQSIPYWGFGLLTSGYRNIIIMRGPVEDRARIIHDLAAAAQHNPWEFAHRGSAEKGLAKTGSSLKANEMLWRAHQKRAKSLLSESIQLSNITSLDLRRKEMLMLILSNSHILRLALPIKPSQMTIHLLWSAPCLVERLPYWFLLKLKKK